jgi:hypothetical protein
MVGAKGHFLINHVWLDPRIQQQFAVWWKTSDAMVAEVERTVGSVPRDFQDRAIDLALERLPELRAQFDALWAERLAEVLRAMGVPWQWCARGLLEVCLRSSTSRVTTTNIPMSRRRC